MRARLMVALAAPDTLMGEFWIGVERGGPRERERILLGYNMRREEDLEGVHMAELVALIDLREANVDIPDGSRIELFNMRAGGVNYMSVRGAPEYPCLISAVRHRPAIVEFLPRRWTGRFRGQLVE